MRTFIAIALASCLFVSVPVTVLAQKPDFTGRWVLNQAISQNPFEKIDLAMGAEQLPGAGTRADSSVSSGALLRDSNRASTFRALMNFAEVLEIMEVEQTNDELKVWVGDGEQFFSLFYLDGEPHARQLADGLRVEATAAWEGDAIQVMQVGENGARLKQIFSRHGEAQLAFVFQLVSKLSESPVQFRVVYDPAREN